MVESACTATPYVNEYPHNARHTLDYTYSLDRLSCVREIYFLHIMFAYLVFLTGLFCLLSRLLPFLHKWHAFSGRLYILSMIWCMGSSLLVHNVGLPVGVLVSFFIVLVGLTLGWGCVKLHQAHVQEEVMKRVVEKMVAHEGVGELAKVVHETRREILTERTVAERLISYKAAHGALMFMSWINIAGRIFASNQSGDFTCYTYPVYKQLDSAKFDGLNKTLTYVPIEDASYGSMPWAASLAGWGIGLSIGPLVGAFAVGAVVAQCLVSYGGGGKKTDMIMKSTENEKQNIMPLIYPKWQKGK
jgi:hypothetical protein